MIEKRHVVLAVMVLALGTAVYINWRFGGEALQANSDLTSSYGTLGEVQYVNGSLAQSSSTESGTASAPESSIGSGSDYFIQAELSRQSVRDKALKTLDDLLSATSGVDEALLQEAVTRVAEITKCAEQENKIESLLKAKGYSECVAFLSEGKANVVVRSNGLLASETITIKDIVAGQSGISFENIIIVEVK